MVSVRSAAFALLSVKKAMFRVKEKNSMIFGDIFLSNFVILIESW